MPLFCNLICVVLSVLSGEDENDLCCAFLFENLLYYSYKMHSWIVLEHSRILLATCESIKLGIIELKNSFLIQKLSTVNKIAVTYSS